MMKKLFFILFILGIAAPFKASAYPVSINVSFGYPYTYHYSSWGYMGLGWPYLRYSYYVPNYSEVIRLVKADVAMTNELAALGEAQKAAWMNGGVPRAILPPPAPVPPETLQAPEIKVQRAE